MTAPDDQARTDADSFAKTFATTRAATFCPACGKRIEWSPVAPFLKCPNPTCHNSTALRLSKSDPLPLPTNNEDDTAFKECRLTEREKRDLWRFYREHFGWVMVRHISAHLSTIVSLFLAILSILLSVVAIPWLTDGLQVNVQTIRFVIGASVMTLILYTIGVWSSAYISLSKLPPSDYARVALEGARLDHQMRWLALEMMLLVEKVLNGCADDQGGLETIQLEILKNLNAGAPALANLREVVTAHHDVAFKGWTVRGWTLGRWPPSRWKPRRIKETPRKLVDQLQVTVRKSNNRVQRVLRMKTRLAEELGVSPRRLCDHVYRFSPAMFYKRAEKLAANWEIILKIEAEAEGESAGPPNERVKELIAENVRIIRRMRRRLNYLRLIAASPGLANDLTLVVGSSSTREALVAYADAISRVAGAAINQMNERMKALRPGNPNRVPTTDDWKDDQNLPVHLRRLVAATYMQRAEAGGSLHLILTRLSEQGCHWCSARQQYRDLERPDEPDLKQRWDDMGQLWGRRAKILRRMSTPSGVLELSHSDLMDLRQLGFDVMSAQFSSRQETNALFKIEMARRFAEDSKPIVIAFGYSKAVRDAIKVTFLSGAVPADRVFVSSDTTNELEARFMEFQLGEDRAWVKVPGLKFGFGKVLILAKLARLSKTPFLILTGARCFDLKGRVVVETAPHQMMGALKRILGDRATFVAIAEGHKCFADLSNVRELFRDGLDDVTIFDGDFFDRIISDTLAPLLPPQSVPAAATTQAPAS